MHAKIRTFQGQPITHGALQHAGAALGRGRIAARPQEGVVGYARPVRAAELAAALEADAAGAAGSWPDAAHAVSLTL